MIYRLRSYHGGLGDELQFSTLPEMLTKAGHEVYLLVNSNEVQPLRNKEIKRLVWLDNPYIKGEIEGEWNLGDMPNLYQNTEGDFIKNWEKAFGLQSENSLPKIYYEPGYLTPQEGLIELGAISLKYNPERVIEIVQDIVSNSCFKFKQIISDNQPNNIVIPNVEKIEFSGLTNIYSALCNCKCFISLSSGLQSVAAAARRVNPKMKQYTIHPEKDSEWILKSRLFVYPGVSYIKE